NSPPPHSLRVGVVLLVVVGVGALGGVDVRVGVGVGVAVGVGVGVGEGVGVCVGGGATDVVVRPQLLHLPQCLGAVSEGDKAPMIANQCWVAGLRPASVVVIDGSVTC
ncbi:MAG: hypothetical protein F4Y63_03990, partial [Chloroflexi bacterium]|nr:hypothetical protein [Chloroflexota bacterium]